ncbi:MAG: hypothetical protein GX189_10025 [Clostridiales bacterium]|nr:hypothetical protein [Clostridiales bacterium]
MKNQNFFPIERNRYFYGKLLTVRDFEVEQKYFNDKRRLLNMAVTGAGVVCGLNVTQSDETTIMVESGLAIDYKGREIIVDAPVIKKLQMLDGYAAVEGKTEAFLCLRYDEYLSEQVNAVGADSDQHSQHNRVVETYRLSLETEEPDIAAICDASGRTQTALLYCKDGIRIALSLPLCAVAGEEFAVDVLVTKEAGSLLLDFDMRFESEAATDLKGNKKIALHFTEGPEEKKAVYRRQYKLRAVALAGMSVRMASSAVELRVRMGDLNDAAAIPLDSELRLVKNHEELENYLAQKDTLVRRINISDLPIYLAKLDLMPIRSTSVIRNIAQLPFDQRLHGRGGREEKGLGGVLSVTSEVRTLKYWQKPEAYADYNAATGTLSFRFGIPTSEEYEYSTSSGLVEIPLSGGLRVNARYYSDEIPHNLGPGNVNISLAVVFQDKDERQALAFGNGEVFRGKNGIKAVPQVETAAVLYPEKGTFRVGVWLKDDVEGSSILVRYFASKVSKDVDDLKLKNKVSIQVLPEIQRVRVRERLHLKAIVTGTEDHSVIWSIKDKDGGSIDSNGLYQAPDTRGTYEIVCQSVADPECKVSTFVIVED